MTPRVAIKQRPIPTSVLRAYCIGEFMQAFGADPQYISDMQDAVARGHVARVVVYGMDAYGNSCDEVALRFDRLAKDGAIVLDTGDGRSTIEALDVGFAAAVDYCVKLMARKGLRPLVRHFYASHVDRNPTLRAQVDAQHNFIATPPVRTAPASSPTLAEDISYPPGHERKHVLTLTPGKDTGMHLDIFTARRK